jgi:N-acetylglucosamine-6-sulfatase
MRKLSQAKVLGQIFAVWLGIQALCPVSVQAGVPPNILFILTDDLRYDALGVNGHPYAQTPNIDRIANEGISFNRAYTVSPLCSVSRASFLTGQYPQAHMVQDNSGRPHDGRELVTFPMLLRRAGYLTAFFGKWHFGKTGGRAQPGFDYWAGVNSQGKYVDPVVFLNGRKTKFTGYSTDVFTGLVLDFIRSPRKQPFLLYLSYKAVHGPFTPASRHEIRYDEESGKGKELDQIRTLMAVDEGVGRLLDALVEEDELDNTLVIFTSDSGIGWSKDPERPVFTGDKRSPYEFQAIRIPLLARFPSRIGAGTRIDALVANVDIMPSILELAEIAIPPQVSGYSFWPLLTGEGANWRDVLLIEYWRDSQPNLSKNDPWRAVVSQRWKFVDRLNAHPVELYDLKSDPLELVNLAGRKPLVESRLRNEMTHLVKVAKQVPNGGNHAPVARADIVGNFTGSSMLVLDGSRSSDEDGDILSYHWQQVAGPHTLRPINQPGSATTAVQLGQPGNYRFRLTIWDDSLSALDEVAVIAGSRPAEYSEP